MRNFIGWLVVWSVFGAFGFSVLVIMVIAMNGHPIALLALIPLAAACCMFASAAMDRMVS